MRALVPALMALSLGCSQRTFVCESSSQCIQHGERGTCVEGGCAFADPGCPGGGLRWVDEAPFYGGQCVAGLGGDDGPGSGGGGGGGPDAGGNAGGDAEAVAWTGPCLTATHVSSGASHSCLVTAVGEVWCWGANESGQLGTSGGDSASPVRALAASGFQAAAGGAHSCASLLDATVSCWGRNDDGQLGRGSRTARELPGAVPGMSAVEAITAGAGHSCISRMDDAWCWGRNEAGQVKIGAADTASPVLSAVHVNGPAGPFFQGVTAGGAHTVAIDYDIPFIYPGGVYTWGADAPALGRPFSSGYGLVSGIFPRRIAAGDRHACAIHDVGPGQLYCWGENEAGQVGLEGGPFASAMPITLPFTPWEISAGGRHTCVVSGGQALCFGDDTQGQLGGGQGGALARAVVPGSWSQVAAGGAHTCALDTSGAVWCWGANDRGQLGRAQDGSSDPQPIVAACP